MSSTMVTSARQRRLARSTVLASAVLLTLITGAARGLEVVVGAGEYDVEREGDGPIEANLVFRLTGTEIWRSKSRGMLLVPSFGATATVDKSYYGWVGGALLIPLGTHWGLAPEVGVGAYEQGGGKNLGGSLEFRSGLEVTYRANDSVRVGVGFYHLSNAGLHAVNPGVNSLLLTLGFKPKSHARVWDTHRLH